MRIGTAAILDGYVDEPTCLGVPPYISPYPRYAAGALRSGRVKTSYFTIDQVRVKPGLLDIISRHDLLILIAGTTVPGKYLGGMPASRREIEDIASSTWNRVKVLGGPAARFGVSTRGGKRTDVVNKAEFDIIVKGDLEAVVKSILEEKDIENVDSARKRLPAELAEWSNLGANIIEQHPDYPNVMCEIETYRGCHWRKCSFCSEPMHGEPDYRSVEDIVSEVESLYGVGARYFRIGMQPDLFAYQAYEGGIPNPEALEHLYKGIRNVAPDLNVLHMDNASPATIARYPEESEIIAKIIAKYNTSGDVAALGGETADLNVARANNLNSIPEEVIEAVRILNRVGRKRGGSGLPELLPGLNFVYGLPGETERTYELNFEFLKQILDEGLMVRRINLRQVAVVQGTRLSRDIKSSKTMKKHKRLFAEYKKRIRVDIDRTMLQRLIPHGTVLKNVRMEFHDGNTTFGRQIATYPLLVGVPARLNVGNFFDVAVTDYGSRSVTGVPYPLDINTANMPLLSAIQGIGRKRAIRMVRCRPFRNWNEVVRCLDSTSTAEELRKYVNIG